MKTILYNVDSQNDFIKSDGKLSTPDAESIIKKMEKLHYWAKKRNLQTIYSSDCHFEDSNELSSSPDYIETFPVHCIRGTEGCEVISELKPSKWNFILDWNKDYSTKEINKHYSTTDVLILKDRFDVFSGNPYMNDFLKAVSPDLIIVCGVVSEICVAYAIDGFLNRGKRVILAMDAIKHINYDLFVTKLNQWSKSKDFEIMTVDNVLNTI